MVKSVTKVFNLIKSWFLKLSVREQQLIVLASAVVLIMVFYGIGESVYQSFTDLNRDLEAAEHELTSVSALLSQYSKAKAQRDRIENEFRSVEFKEGELTYLEDLIRRKLNLSGGFTITPRAATKFGVNYEQHPFTIKFTLSDLKLIMEFLSEIVSGSQPLLLTRLNILMSHNKESLEVDMDVSSIKEVAVQ